MLFDFVIKYCSGRANQNADALSRQHPIGAQDLDIMVPGASLPEPLREVFQGKQGEVSQVAVMALPNHSISEIDVFFSRQTHPSRCSWVFLEAKTASHCRRASSGISAYSGVTLAMGQIG